MKKYTYLISLLIFVLINISFTHAASTKSEVKEYPWFKDSFLELNEDLAEAKSEGRGLILYFHQEGCPYCKKLLNDNFSRPELVEKLTQSYDFIALNMWGDRSVIDVDGEQLTEKSLAVKLKVMFTPTLLFLNPQGKVEFRLNGYYSPLKFNTLLDYLRSERHTKFSQYYRQRVQQARLAASQPAVSNPSKEESLNYQQRYQNSDKPMLLVLHEENCSECQELFDNLDSSDSFRRLAQRFNLNRLDIHSKQLITDINGRKLSAQRWADELNVQFSPSLIFYAAGQDSSQPLQETFRLASYVRKFHLESVLLYIADEKYREFPEFQRYIHDRTAQMREKGIPIELWK